MRQGVDEWKKAGERDARQGRATLQALAAISEALVRQNEALARQSEALAQQSETLRDLHAITTRVLEQSNHIMLQLGASGATH
jgi:hypothetical protein